MNNSAPPFSTMHFFLFLLVYWFVSGLWFWNSYSIAPLIRGGFYRFNQAVSLVAAMTLITTVLTGVAWFWERQRHQNSSRPTWRSIWAVTWRTWVCLLLYAGLVLLRMQFGGDVPLKDSAFLPVVGHINSYFFSEAGWLVFLTYIVPVIGCASGVLYYLQARLANKG
jgi:hypothetical protein